MTDIAASPWLQSPADVLGIVPYLLGFHPQDSLVTLRLRRGGRIDSCSCHDLDVPPDRILGELHESASAKRGVTALIVIGYGPPSARGSVLEMISAYDRYIPVRGRFFPTGGRLYATACGRNASALR